MRFTCVMRVLSAHELGGRYYGWTRQSRQAPLAVVICPVELLLAYWRLLLAFVSGHLICCRVELRSLA